MLRKRARTVHRFSIGSIVVAHRLRCGTRPPHLRLWAARVLAKSGQAGITLASIGRRSVKAGSDLTIHSSRRRFAARLNSGVMPHPKIHRYVLLALLVTCTGCADYSAEISNQFKASGKTSIDLQEAVPTQWEKVCVFGPYSDNEEIEQVVGFKWPAESRTNIKDSDGISLLLFVREKSVIEYVEQPRDEGDFARLDGRCFNSSTARFKSVKDARHNWSYLVQEDEA